MKQSNVCREKGLAVVHREARDTSSALRGGQRKITKLNSLTLRARENPKCRFTSLVHLLTEDFLMECFWELKRGRSPGIDRMTVEEYGANLKENLGNLLRKMKVKQYRPRPVKRAYIPKSDGTRRPLGIPTVEDKIVQMGIKKVLEAIFEADFVDESYGFRPKRSCHDALDAVNEAIMTKPINYIVDMDIKKFFDTVNHKWLMRCLRQRIVDPNFLHLVARFLKAGVMEEGKYIEVDKGTPQGGIVSPVLANIYLHYILDLWFKKVVTKQLKGYAELVRYADDFIVAFQSEREAKMFSGMLRQRLAKVGLRIADDKSRIVEFGRYVWYKSQRQGKRIATFDFLGFTHYCAKSRAGKFKLGRKTAKTKYRQKTKAMNQWLKAVRNAVKLKEWWRMLRPKLVGHYRYYGIGGNSPSIQAFYDETIRLVYKWVNRRSQKQSYNWTQFCRFREYNPLPKPRIYHPYPIIAKRTHY